jgi:hypothetical protein
VSGVKLGGGVLLRAWLGPLSIASMITSMAHGFCLWFHAGSIFIARRAWEILVRTGETAVANADSAVVR